MTKYIMTNNQDAERFVVDCKDSTEARHWIINNVDYQKSGTLKKIILLQKIILMFLIEICKT
jgi:hypothetical protein